jgi:hypothetical protein
VHADVAHFATLATELAERTGGHEMVNLFQALLDEFRAADSGWPAITAADVWRRYQRLAAKTSRPDTPAMAPASPAFQQRFARLVQPLSVDGTFAGGWRFGPVSACPGRVEVELRHERESSLVVEIVPRGRGRHFRRSRHYDIRAAARELTAAQREALATLSRAIAANDR